MTLPVPAGEQRRTPKASLIQLRQRLALIQEWWVSGLGEREVRRRIVETWHVRRRTARKYFDRVKARVTRDPPDGMADELQLLRLRYGYLYTEAMRKLAEAQDAASFATILAKCVQVLRSQTELNVLLRERWYYGKHPFSVT